MQRLSAYSILAVAILSALPVQAQSGSDGGIIPPVLRRHSPAEPREQTRVPFGAGEAALPHDAIRVLDRLTDRMRAQPRAKVILYGFADPEEYTDESSGRRLAQRRAEAARDYLLLKGMEVQGMRLEVILPPANYNPPIKSPLRRPASYVEARLLPWDE